jgi:hypothetical protein
LRQPLRGRNLDSIDDVLRSRSERLGDVAEVVPHRSLSAIGIVRRDRLDDLAVLGE